MKHFQSWRAPQQSRQNLLEKERLQLAWRAGQERNDLIAFLKPQARSGAARVFKRFGTFRDHRLAQIVFRHLAAEGTKSGGDGADHRLIANKLASQQFCDGFPRQVVLGGPETAATDRDRHTIECLAKSFEQHPGVISDDGFADDFDAQLVQLLGKEQ